MLYDTPFLHRPPAGLPITVRVNVSRFQSVKKQVPQDDPVLRRSPIVGQEFEAFPCAPLLESVQEIWLRVVRPSCPDTGPPFGFSHAQPDLIPGTYSTNGREATVRCP